VIAVVVSRADHASEHIGEHLLDLAGAGIGQLVAAQNQALAAV